eukprot:TRINITY_DN18510_c1_g1_i2.p1 TRINITY_DN18510_c1_g1~~TRINITY_DN18510_c1_g1_i2.p1  ORF type:complete len:113 (-),score=10.04 TRINITY_DN18510_c1_g1_i2:17-355(-)
MLRTQLEIESKSTIEPFLDIKQELRLQQQFMLNNKKPTTNYKISFFESTNHKISGKHDYKVENIVLIFLPFFTEKQMGLLEKIPKFTFDLGQKMKEKTQAGWFIQTKYKQIR